MNSLIRFPLFLSVSTPTQPFGERLPTGKWFCLKFNGCPPANDFTQNTQLLPKNENSTDVLPELLLTFWSFCKKMGF
jgi:hypothetical protein